MGGLLREYKAGVLGLTFICGLIDAACFLALGGVFAELMTGNLLLLAFTVGSRTWVMSQFVAFGSAILAFCLGALLAGFNIGVRRIGNRRARRIVGYPMEFGVVVLATVLAIVLNPPAVSPAILDSGEDVPVVWSHILIVALLAFGMGIHNALMRKKGVPDIATNVMTLTLAGLISESSLAGGNNPNWQRRAGSIALFITGAALGAALLSIHVSAPLVAASLVFAVALYPLIKGRDDAGAIASFTAKRD